MDFFHFFNLKAQKAVANILWCSHLRSLTKFLRLIELFLALILVFWVSNRLPVLVTVSSEFLWRIAGVIARPVFVFMICNAIIVTLIVKSGRLAGEIPAADNAETELYEELLRNNESYRCSKLLPSENRFSSPHYPAHATKEIEYQDKEMIVASKINSKTAIEATDGSVEMGFSSDSDNPRVYLRSKSEKLQRTNDEEKAKAKKQLRRSGTEKCRNIEDGMSDEEFQQAVDEFIAKHLSFRRQESLSNVLQNQISICEMNKS